MFLWPPRPEKAIPREMIPFFEGQKWFAQIKKNGTCTVIDVDADGVPTFYTRHKELHKAWVAPDYIVDYFSTMPNSVIVGELLHNKHSSVKNTLYLFDVLVYRGEQLVGSTYQDRYSSILSTMPETPNVFIAKNYTDGFLKLYDNLVDEIDEGLVFKNPNAKLKFCFKEGTNADWQVKCRKATKNFSF